MQIRRLLLLGALLCLFFWPAFAASAISEADRLWLLATEAFNDQLYGLAQRTLDRFILRYPDDPRTPIAVLLLAKTRVALGALERAVDGFRQAQRFETPPGEPGEVQFLEGKTLLDLKRYAEAQVAFEAVLRAPASPLTPDALYGLARAALHQNQLEPAVEALRRLLTGWPIHPTAPAATYHLARALADLNRPAEVRTVLAGYETAYSDSPWLADALYLRGWSQLTTGQLEAATNTLESFLARAPAHALAPQAQLHLAEALLRLGKNADGLQHLKTLLVAPIPIAELLYATGLLAQRFDAPAEAEQAWRRLQLHSPTHPLAYRAGLELARIAFTQQRYAEALAAATAASASSDPQVQLEARLLSGESLLQLKRYAEAQVAFEAVLRTPASPLTPHALYGLVRAALHQNQPEPAVEALRQLLTGWPIHPTAPAATYHLARALADLNRPGEVRTVLAGYETTYPESPWLADALYLRGWSQLTTGQLEAAANTLQSFLARAPAHALVPQAQLHLAEALLRLGKNADGLQHLKTLLVAPIPIAELLYDTGLLAQRFDAPAEAEQAWRRLQVHFPTHPLAYRASLELARAALTHQRYAEALAAVTAAAASADPQVQLEARLLSGESLLQLKRYAEARAAFEAVLRTPTSPLTPHALYGLAESALHQNQPEPAVEALRRLLTGWPTHPTAPAATYQLARALADLNRPGEARTVLAGYETTYPDSPWLTDALYLRGWSQLTTGHLEAATNTLQSFLARAPAHALAPQAQFYLAEALLRLGKKADGLQQLHTLLAAPAPTAELLYDTGLLAQRFDAPAEAEQAWRRLQAHSPTHPLAYRASLELARTAFTQQRYAEALAAATAAAASADPQVQLEARLLSGESLLQLKRAGAALREFKTALDQTPSDHPLRLRAMAGLGLAHERLQQWAAATRLYQEVANSSDDELKEWALQRLKAIRSQRQPGSEKIPKQGREGSPSAKPTPER